MKTVCVLREEFGRRYSSSLAVIDKENVEEAAKFLGCDIVWPEFGVQRPLLSAKVKFSYKRLSKDKRWMRLPNEAAGIAFSFGGIITDSIGAWLIRLEIPFHASNKKAMHRYHLECVTLFP